MTPNPFRIGDTYSRQDIHAAIGGGLRSCLLTSRGDVVGICFTPALNPGAPRVILVGRGTQRVAAAQRLALQEGAVPVFAKRAPGAYEHLGRFRGRRYSASAKDRAKHAKGARRREVAGVLELAPG